MPSIFSTPTERDLGKWFVAVPDNRSLNCFCGVLGWGDSPANTKLALIPEVGDAFRGDAYMLSFGIASGASLGYRFIRIPAPR